MQRQNSLSVAVLAATLVLPGVAFAEKPTAITSEGPPVGLGIGVEVGEPSSVTVRYALGGGKFAFKVGAGTGVMGGMGLQIHGDITFSVITIGKRASTYLGIGARYYQHDYEEASIDEIPDTHIGLRAPIGLALPIGKVEVHLEAAPGYDLDRSQSCSLLSGANSVCPHSVASRFFVQATVGVRFYL